MSYFTKTRKGLEEIDTRSAGLHPRARRLLILIDGRRSTDELVALLNDARFEETLAVLQEGGFIEVEVVAESAPAPLSILPPPRVGMAASTAGSGQIDTARHFMMNTLKTFNGPYSKLSLIQRIHACSNRDELLALVGDWLNSISETRSGRQRADELNARLLAVI